ncbi:Hypothetical predicted protein [Mytilus galloprovincialis]|nr:Hypothetical predicted protein [Mytilus galloprovincialis]
MPILSDLGYAATTAYLIIIGVLGFFANSFVILVLLKAKINFRGIHNKLLLNIAISDLVVSVTAVPLSASSSFAKHWLFSDVGCTIAGFVMFTCCLNDINTHAAIAIYRFIVICKPQYVPIFGWSRYTPESFGVSCSIAWFDNSAAVLANNIAIVIGCYCIHVIIFTFCYSNIIRTFSKTSTTVARLREEIITDAHTLKLESMLKYHKILTYRKVTLASLAMVSAFLIAWSPYAIICLFFMISEARPSSTWPYIVPTMFAKSSIVLSPLSCALFSSSFRKSVKQLFSKSGEDYNDIEDGTELQAIAPLKS